MSSSSVPAGASFGGPLPYTPGSITTPQFNGFPLSMNLGSVALLGVDGLTSRAAFQTMQAALNTRGLANGLAGLDVNALVPMSQIPVGVANGVAGLDANSQIPVAQVPTTLNATTMPKVSLTGSGSTGVISGMSVAVPNGVARSMGDRALDAVRLADFGAVYGSSSVASQSANAAALSAAQAAMPFGGDIYLGRNQIDFPTGLTLGNTTGSAYRLIGEGNTAVFVNGATGNFMKLNPGSQVRGFQLVHRDTRTAGMDFDVTSSNTIQDIGVSGYFVFIGSTTGTKANINGLITVTGITARDARSGAGSGLIDLPYQHAGRFSYITATGLVNVPGPDFGIHLKHGDTAEIDHVNISVHGRALYVNPGSGEFISFVTVRASYLDSARGVPCLVMQPAIGGTILQWSFSDVEIGNAGQFNGGAVQPSALLDGTGGGITDIDFTGVKFPGVVSTGANDPQAQAFAGLYAIGASGSNNISNIRFTGGSASNAQSGLRFNNVVNFSVVGFHSGNVAGAAGNVYGIYIEGTSNNYVATNNILLGNTTSPLIDAATGTPKKIVSPNITP